ncbi:MAG: hypothetical protein IIU20_03415 [Bacteroidales bacterium]|jgi:hypothetical protein|nr:hypothetical protein [Bacteroidales bacterium]MBQ2531163.1 hypothetical protein [Bacteroidales bacterium]MBQ5410802.1 hypothetical protein [Bacteroidales bacterium]MCR5133226.1 hypothetical protein [Bacteroidales bacterium]
MTGMKNRFVLTYVLLVIAQMLLCNYFHFTPYIMLTILPIMVFCIPTRVSVFWTLIIAFVTGLAVDYFAEGIIGLNAAALLPVAILRRTLIEAIFGPEPFEQEENITVKKYGLAKVSLAIFIITAIFLLIYNIADCAGTRPFIFILAKVCLSLLASYILSLLAINLLSYDDRR